MPSVLRVLILLILVWGAVAFGAVYPWTYWPLLGACAIVGVCGLLIRDSRVPVNRALALGLTAIAATAVVQLVPLPRAIFASVSPAGDAFLREYDMAYAAGSLEMPVLEAQPDLSSQIQARHPLSINPDSTRLGLAFLVAFSLFLLGACRVVSLTGVTRLVRRLIVFAVLLGFFAIIQNALADGRVTEIYGFWRPRYRGNPFGPFVNRNHFAGWMLMTLPLALGYFCAELGPAMRQAGKAWRERILWLSSPQTSRVGLIGFAILISGLSLVMSKSRSGLGCFAAALIVAGWFVMRVQTSRVRRWLTVSYLVFLLVAAVAWAGTDTAFARFTTETERDGLTGRLTAWRDTLHIIQDFPLTGSGLNTYSTAMMAYQTPDPYIHFQEAHNDYLQLAAEGGILLGVPIIVTIGIFVRDVRRRFREDTGDRTIYWIRAGAVTGLIAIALQSLVEFSLQMPGNAALFTVLAAIALHEPLDSRSKDAHRV